MFYDGVKNTSETTIDGDLPVIVTMTAPTVAVPSNKGVNKLTINQGNSVPKINPIDVVTNNSNNNSSQ